MLNVHRVVFPLKSHCSLIVANMVETLPDLYNNSNPESVSYDHNSAPLNVKTSVPLSLSHSKPKQGGLLHIPWLGVYGCSPGLGGRSLRDQASSLGHYLTPCTTPQGEKPTLPPTTNHVLINTRETPTTTLLVAAEDEDDDISEALNPPCISSPGTKPRRTMHH